MPPLESCRFAGTVADASGRVLGEARGWGTGERGDPGGWSGWLRAADLAGKIAPGRYTITAFEGWAGEFEVGTDPARRVFETDLLPITGIGGPPWPETAGSVVAPARFPPVAGTPWQGAQGIPPHKQQGDNPSRPLPRLREVRDPAE